MRTLSGLGRAHPNAPFHRAPIASGLTFFCGMLPMIGCQNYVFEQVCTEQVVEQDQSFLAPEPTPADILFVVDNSGSMREEQENLADNFELFINELAGTGNYRIAVITTDQSSVGDEERAGLATFLFSDVEPYRARLRFDLDFCTDTGIPLGCFRGDDPAARIIDSSALSPQDQVAFFQRNVRVGTCGSGTEQGLRAMENALSKLDGGQCNTGFVRPDANLVLIFVSDENDDDDAPIADYVQFLGTIKSYDQIRVATIVGFADGSAADCRTGVDGRADPICGDLCLMPPPLGSQNRCTADGSCGEEEVCYRRNRNDVFGECRNDLWRLWSDENCSSCSVFEASTCCLADAGSRYVEFARALEVEIAAATPGIEATGCDPSSGQRSACLLDSVCQASFGETLVRIARELVIVDQYRLTPTAENPDGVLVRVVGGRFGDDGRPLTSDEYAVITDNAGRGVSLRILDRDLLPTADERLQIVYVSDVEEDTTLPPEVCGRAP